MQLDTGQWVAYVGGALVSINGWMNSLADLDFTLQEFLGVAGLVVVVARFAFDIYKDQRDQRNQREL